MLEKSLTMHADNVTYDLEDSVAPSLKASARTNLRSLLSKPRPAGVKEMCVRINSVDTGLALDDLTEVLQGEYLDAIMLPKCESAADLHFVGARKPDLLQLLLRSNLKGFGLREIAPHRP